MLQCTLRKTIIVVALALCLCLVVALALYLCLPVASSSDSGSQDRAGLRILYAGLLETDRAKDFVAFLGEHFAKVETTDYNTFTGSQAAGFDVTIIDHDGADIEAPRLLLHPFYGAATITIGVPGAHICSRLNLKTAYL
jgi:hypothetical protein